MGNPGVFFRIFCVTISIAVPVVLSGCPTGYNLFGKSTCISEVREQYDIEQMKSNCKDDGAKVGGPFADDMWDDFSKAIKDQVLKEMENFKPWVGIMKKPPAGLSDDGKWKYVYDDEEFDPGDYPFFKRKPQKDEQCAYISVKDFKVVPCGCNEGHNYYCQKKEAPCEPYLGNQYANYYRACLLTSLSGDNFDNTKWACQNSGGGMIALRNESMLRSAKAGLYNFPFCGGLYVGLQKNSDGDWVYLDGSPGPPDSLWVEDDPKDHDCAFLQVNHDFSIQYASRDCDARCRYVCQYTVE